MYNSGQEDHEFDSRLRNFWGPCHALFLFTYSRRMGAIRNRNLLEEYIVSWGTGKSRTARMIPYVRAGPSLHLLILLKDAATIIDSQK